MSVDPADSPSKFRRGGDNIEVRVLVPSKSAGAIIGKGGSTIKRLRDQYKAHVNVPDSNGPERVLTMQAGEESVQSLMSEVFQCLLDDAQREARRSGPNGDSPMSEGSCDVRLLIHQSQAGAVIGRSGSKVKELRETSGLRNLKVFTDPCPNSTDRVVQLIGEPSKCAQTVMTILNILKEAPPKGPVNNYNPASISAPEITYGGWNGGMVGGAPPSQFPMDSNYGGGAPRGPRPPFPAGGARPGGFGAGGGDVQTTQVSIPDKMTGAIMGRGGSRIKQIRLDSGAEIKIDPALPGQEDRIITIRGTPEQIQTAQYLLQMCVKN